MTPEKIIELAQSVGLTLPRRGEYFFINHEDLGRLLLAEREACAKVCDKYADVLDPLRPKGEAADYFQGGVKSASRRNAAAIRARGQL